MYPCSTSGALSSSAAVSTRPCLIHAITLIQASAACSVALYDNASSNAGVIAAYVASVTNGITTSIVFNHPVLCSNGIYASLAGSGVEAIVYYSPL